MFVIVAMAMKITHKKAYLTLVVQFPLLPITVW